MNKHLLIALSCAMTASAICSAQTGTLVPTSTYVPPVGNMTAGYYAPVDLNEYIAGLSSFSLNGKWTINREAKGFATLKVNGEVVKQLPANNTEAIYCLDGYDRVDTGSPLFVFTTDNAQTTPYKYTGYYEVIIPAGFLISPNGTPNVEAVARYQISNPQIVSSPASGSSVAEVEKIVLDFPGAASVAGGAGMVLEFYGTDSFREYTYTTEISGSTVTITPSSPITSQGRVMLSIPDKCFTVSHNVGPKTSTNFLTSVTFNVSGSIAVDGWSTTPAAGTYADFPSQSIAGTETEYSPDPIQAYFKITPPKGSYLTAQASANKVQLIDKNDPSNVVTFTTGRMAGSAAEGEVTDQGFGYLYSSTYTLWRAENTLAPKAGEYELVVPANTFYTNNGSETKGNAELRFPFTVTGSETPAVYTLSPANDRVIDEVVNTITVTFPEASSVDWRPGSSISIANGTISFSASAAAKGNALEITIPGGMNTDGRYNFEIPSTALIVDGRGTPLEFTYDVDLPDPYAGMTFFPPFNAEAESNVVNLEAYPQGVSSISIEFDAQAFPRGVEVNRNAKGYATLTWNGKVYKEIPASNIDMIYTYVNTDEGSDKAPTGALQIVFYDNQLTSTAKYTGNYEVTIPAGFFRYAGTDIYNDEITANYQIVGNARMEVTPAQDTTLDELQTMTVTFPEATSVILSGRVNVELLSTDGADVDRNVEASEVNISGNTATITLAEPVSGNGRLLLSFYSGAFTVGYENGSESITGMQIYRYTLNSRASEVTEVTLDPAPGTYESIVSTPIPGNTNYAYFKIVLPEDVKVSMIVGNAKIYPVVNGQRDAAGAISLRNITVTEEDGSKSYYLGSSTFADWYKESVLPLTEGAYELVLPNDFLFGSGLAELSFSYEILGVENNVDYTVYPDPAEPVAELQYITIYFPDAKTIEVANNARAEIKSGIAEYVATMDVNDLDCEGVELAIRVPGTITTSGVYEINISGADLKIDGMPIPMTLTYEVDSTLGVDGIATDESDAPVYSLTGVKVAQGSEALKTLAPGIYILNGKKVIVRK